MQQKLNVSLNCLVFKNTKLTCMDTCYLKKKNSFFFFQLSQEQTWSIRSVNAVDLLYEAHTQQKKKAFIFLMADLDNISIHQCKQSEKYHSIQLIIFVICQ